MSPITRLPLSGRWRDRLSADPASDSAARDRDLKLLAWLEYAETLADVFRSQQNAMLVMAPRSIGDGEGDTSTGDDTARERAGCDTWTNYAARWDAWAAGWVVRSDT
jgi:hypothetical protein